MEADTSPYRGSDVSLYDTKRNLEDIVQHVTGMERDLSMLWNALGAINGMAAQVAAGVRSSESLVVEIERISGVVLQHAKSVPDKMKGFEK